MLLLPVLMNRFFWFDTHPSFADRLRCRKKFGKMAQHPRDEKKYGGQFTNKSREYLLFQTGLHPHIHNSSQWSSSLPPFWLCIFALPRFRRPYRQGQTLQKCGADTQQEHRPSASFALFGVASYLWISHYDQSCSSCITGKHFRTVDRLRRNKWSTTFKR